MKTKAFLKKVRNYVVFPIHLIAALLVNSGYLLHIVAFWIQRMPQRIEEKKEKIKEYWHWDEY